MSKKGEGKGEGKGKDELWSGVAESGKGGKGGKTVYRASGLDAILDSGGSSGGAGKPEMPTPPAQK